MYRQHWPSSSGLRSASPSGAALLMVSGLVIGLGLGAAACGSGGDAGSLEVEEGNRSSGQLAYSDEPSAGDNPGDGTDDAKTGDGSAGGPSGETGDSGDSGAMAGPGLSDPGSSGEGSSVFVPPVRLDGIEFVYQDGALGPARLGATIEEISQALGSSYQVAAEEQIRVDFPSGYSISHDGEVLFWAIEEGGVITTFMTTNPRVGLDSGLRPRLSLAEAVTLHGEPTLTVGPEVREFVRFADGTGSEPWLSVLVAIGQFGGPVGVYGPPGPELGAETTGYELEEANIKELWFLAAA